MCRGHPQLVMKLLATNILSLLKKIKVVYECMSHYSLVFTCFPFYH